MVNICICKVFCALKMEIYHDFCLMSVCVLNRFRDVFFEHSQPPSFVCLMFLTFFLAHFLFVNIRRDNFIIIINHKVRSNPVFESRCFAWSNLYHNWSVSVILSYQRMSPKKEKLAIMYSLFM